MIIPKRSCRPLPTTRPARRPAALAIDQGGRAWLAEAGPAALCLVDTDTRRSETSALPHTASRPADVAVSGTSAAGTDATSGRLGQYRAATNRFELFELPQSLDTPQAAPELRRLGSFRPRRSSMI